MDDPEEWFEAYAGKLAALLGDAARVHADLASRWSARSLEDDEWTVDTVTADLIEAWEHLTPLAGRGIELWLELVQQGMRREPWTWT